jgi:hypothetical protein
MFQTFLFLFGEGATVADATEGMRAMCYAVTRVLMRDLVTNCSAAVDPDSYRGLPVPGRPRELDVVTLRVATPQPTHDPSMWLESTRAEFDAALRAAGFYKTSPPEARMRQIMFSDDAPTVYLVLFFVVFFLAAKMVVEGRGVAALPQTSSGLYARLPQAARAEGPEGPEGLGTYDVGLAES